MADEKKGYCVKCDNGENSMHHDSTPYSNPQATCGMSKVLEDVIRERHRQDELWGVQDHQQVFYYLILAEEVGEVAKAILEGGKPRPGFDLYHYPKKVQIREELVQVAAVAVAMIESLDRNGI